MGTEFDQLYTDVISQALLKLQSNHHQDWCLPRAIAYQPSLSGTKRKANDEVDLPTILKHLAAAEEKAPQVKQLNLRWVKEVDQEDCEHQHSSKDSCHCHEITEPWDHHISNSARHPRKLQVSSSEYKPTNFIIPPGASFYHADCALSMPFHTAVRKQARSEQTASRFECIVIDPPWPNSSVSRARRSGYVTAPTMWDIRQMVFDMDIDVLLADNGLIAVWITNKPAVRNLVLGEDGFFESWGVTLEEEWLWVKTTRSGVPVSPLNALWRKPYEVLLLGRKQPREQPNDDSDSQSIRRRVIAGVPDLHSRKPCLKELIDPLMPRHSNGRTLEVFARYLIADWWSWGNETLKFNHERCWIC
ncbi:hypothetical protein AAFC00_006893 [Neodothiora populina]|uniref:MT-A70-domain-containing protein n=1 Tax=Neodothiora populina TaxID=2781224 RepID=A0ABR3PC42_9PEZI